MGLAAVIQHDALRMLRQQGNEGLDLFLFAGRQGSVAHLHFLICKAVRETVGPCRGAYAVFCHSGPIRQTIKVRPAAQHHGCGCQRAGAAAALLEIETRVHIQIHCQSSRQAGKHYHQRQHKAQQFFAEMGRCSGIHGRFSFQLLQFLLSTAIKYTSLLPFCKRL